MKLKKGSKEAKEFMSKIRARKKQKNLPDRKYKKINLEIKPIVKLEGVKKNILIFEYKVSYSGKYYVSSNMELKGIGIKKVGAGQDHTRGLKTYIMTITALKKLQNLFGKENTKYIESDY